MRAKTAILFFLALSFASCKTYEVVHEKAAEIDKVGKLNQYTIYLHSKAKIFKVANPALSPEMFKGDLTPVTDQTEAEEIRAPKTKHELKKHKHDLNIFTKTDIKDTIVLLKRAEITDVSRTVTHAHVNWNAIGIGANTLIATAMCVTFIGGLIYWFSLGFR